ncbi:class I SAM-dependent methyltransferase [Synechococcus sp. CBW1107]|jgi:cyclopropane-fatty-acyl-phospholipid synthase|nr:class I SAM-dependent methyltransferase [Synechococcus sp. CBW1107]CAK6693097.1 Ubiquinone biosynthesis O-methyltransferase, mitochondrial [Synechococcus sp. CBW1107]
MLESTPVRDSGVHYNNDPRLFELFLDSNLNYSSGVFCADDETLDQAQINKMQGIAASLGIKEGQRILDVGCGWSGPAVYFAEHYGCHITGVNLSAAQRAYGLNRAAQHGVDGRVQIEVKNVLDLDYPAASFDSIMFLESIIHMPEKEAIFRSCHDLLRPGGKIFIQESHYDRASMRGRYLSDRGATEVDRSFGNTMDMVTGGEMLCLLESAELIPLALQDISMDYVRTLSLWLQNIDRHAEPMMELSRDAYLMLRRYLMIALNTYREGGTVCYQITASKR